MCYHVLFPVKVGENQARGLSSQTKDFILVQLGARRGGLYLFLYVFFRQRQIVPERKEPQTLFAPVYQLFPVDFRGFFTCFVTHFFLCVIFQYRFSTVFQLHFCQFHGRPFCGTSKCASALA